MKKTALVIVSLLLTGCTNKAEPQKKTEPVVTQQQLKEQQNILDQLSRSYEMDLPN